jgi:hypothetical protein
MAKLNTQTLMLPSRIEVTDLQDACLKSSFDALCIQQHTLDLRGSRSFHEFPLQNQLQRENLLI